MELSERLAELTEAYGFSVKAGHIRVLNNQWFVTHTGLVALAHRESCAGIRTALQVRFCDPVANRWVFRATVYTKRRSRAFVGYGDADPSNTSPLMRGTEMRIAETRAANRALRKAYGIGLCSFEELGYASRSDEQDALKDFTPSNGHGRSNGQPRLRDQLCLLIRKHNLDPHQVKRYAADFCGTEELRAASRERVESFVSRLAEEATKDRAALICKLNSYGHAEAVKS